MPYNGSGIFTRVYNWVNDANASVNITASRFDTEDSGFATGLSNCITKDGQQTITANIPWNNKKITGLGAGTGATDAAQIGQVQGGQLNWVAAGGTADAITAVFSPVNTALTDGLLLYVRAGAANATTTPTFAPDGLTAHTITKTGGIALAANDIVGAGHELIFRYNLANTRWEYLNAATAVTDATISTTDITTNNASTSKHGFQAKAANSATTYYDSLGTQTNPALNAVLTGYTSGTGTVAATDTIIGAIQKLNGNTPAVTFNAITGFLPSSITGTHTTASFTLSTGQAADSGNTAYITKGTTTAWLASNGNAINGTDAASSTLANSSTYHIFVCSGGSGTGCFVSASLTPTFPTGYTTYKRRVGSFTTDGSGNPLPYTSVEVEGGAVINWLTTQVLDASAISVGVSRVVQTVSVPSGIKMEWLYRATSTAGSGFGVIITSGDETDVAPVTSTLATVPLWDFSYSSATTINLSSKGDGIITTNTSAQIGFRASSASATVNAVTRGWKDFRRS